MIRILIIAGIAWWLYNQSLKETTAPTSQQKEVEQLINEYLDKLNKGITEGLDILEQKIRELGGELK